MKKIVATPFALAILVLAASVVPAAGHDSTTASGSTSFSGGSAAYAAARDRWGARFTITLHDTSNDSAMFLCVRAIVELIVTDGPDAVTTHKVCGSGNRRTFSYRLSPSAVGSGIYSYRITFQRGYVPVKIVSLGLGQHKRHGTVESLAEANRIFNLPLSQFTALKRQGGTRFDWTDDRDTGASNACSAPANGIGWAPVFNDACARHDFGYRNFGASNGALRTTAGKWLDPTDSRRAHIDSVFLSDMRAICDQTYQYLSQPTMNLTCKTMAGAFYGAVREFGGRAFYGEDD